jgi:hypothetical protein
METNVVMVKLWGMPIGYLSWDKKADVAVFETGKMKILPAKIWKLLHS